MKYWIDFSGYVCVEAESAEDAESKFWQKFVPDASEPFSDDVWNIDGIEERVDGDLLEPVYGGNPTQKDLEDFWNNK